MFLLLFLVPGVMSEDGIVEEIISKSVIPVLAMGILTFIVLLLKRCVASCERTKVKNIRFSPINIDNNV